MKKSRQADRIMQKWRPEDKETEWEGQQDTEKKTDWQREIMRQRQTFRIKGKRIELVMWPWNENVKTREEWNKGLLRELNPSFPRWDAESKNRFLDKNESFGSKAEMPGFRLFRTTWPSVCVEFLTWSAKSLFKECNRWTHLLLFARDSIYPYHLRLPM